MMRLLPIFLGFMLLWCNGSEPCLGGVCAPGVALNCDDANPCTTETCDPASGCRVTDVVNGTGCAGGAAKTTN